MDERSSPYRHSTNEPFNLRQILWPLEYRRSPETTIGQQSKTVPSFHKLQPSFQPYPPSNPSRMKLFRKSFWKPSEGYDPNAVGDVPIPIDDLQIVGISSVVMYSDEQ